MLVDVAGRRCIVVGGGPVATRKARTLAADGAGLVVVAPEIAGALRAMAAECHERPYEGPADLRGAFLAVAATGIEPVDDAVVADAAAGSVLCVRSGAGARAGSASFMGAVQRGPLVLGVATGVPALTRRLREELDDRYGPEYGDMASLLARLRADPALAGVPAASWRSLPLVNILNLLREGAVDAATELASACLSSSSD